MKNLKTFKDKGSTRVDLNSVTSYSKDFDILLPNGKVDTIILTIGSAVRKIAYSNQDDRDSDFSELDKTFDVDSNIR